MNLSLDYRANSWWRDETFLDDLRGHARDRPGAPALIGRRVVEERTDTVSYAELVELIDRFAYGLLDLGVGPGDVVAVQLPDWWELVPLSLACVRISARLCPLIPTYRRYELDYMLTLTEARVCVTMAEQDGVRLAEVITGLDLPRLEHVLVAGGPRPPGTRDFHEHFLGPATEGRDPGELKGRELGPDDPYLILFTSGTTGEPKGVLHSLNTLYAPSRGYADLLGLDEGLVATVASVNTLYSGFVQGLMVPFMLGGTAVFQDVWDGPTQVALFEEHNVTLFYGSYSFLLDLLDEQRARPRNLPAMRYMVTGSAPVPPHAVDEIREVFGVRTYSLWGMTENGPVTITRPEDPEDWAAHSDGTAIAGMELRIDPLEGRSDGVGRLWVRGPTQCLGYFKREELYAAELDDEGWFHTGDLARDDGRGGIRIAGRSKDIIIYTSFNVPVAEVEAVLGRHPRVREVAVIGIPHPEVVEEVCAVVLPQGEPPTLEELREHMRVTGVTSWFWPRRLEVVERMPKTITGKIRKVELRQRYGEA